MFKNLRKINYSQQGKRCFPGSQGDQCKYKSYLPSFQGTLLADNTEWVIKTFPTGEICLENISQNPDVIILDYHLNINKQLQFPLLWFLKNIIWCNNFIIGQIYLPLGDMLTGGIGIIDPDKPAFS
jgi:hypothetical protein